MRTHLGVGLGATAWRRRGRLLLLHDLHSREQRCQRLLVAIDVLLRPSYGTGTNPRGCASETVQAVHRPLGAAAECHSGVAVGELTPSKRVFARLAEVRHGQAASV